jgi:hypothetical protein
MVIQATFEGWYLVVTRYEKVCCPKCVVSSFLGTWGFIFLGWHFMATKKYFFPYGSFYVRNGSEIKFYKDKWLRNITLPEYYPALYNIMWHKSVIHSLRCWKLPHQIYRSGGVLLALDKHRGMLYYSVWIWSIWRKVAMHFDVISLRAANSRCLLCTMV